MEINVHKEEERTRGILCFSPDDVMFNIICVMKDQFNNAILHITKAQVIKRALVKDKYVRNH